MWRSVESVEIKGEVGINVVVEVYTCRGLE